MSTVTVGKTAIDKRKLRDYEPPKVRCKNQGFTVHAEVYKDFLCVNFYLDGLYDFTVFCSDDAYVTKNRSLSKGWTDGCLYNLIDWQPEYGDTTAQGIKISYADRKSAKVGADFYGKKTSIHSRRYTICNCGYVRHLSKRALTIQKWQTLPKT